MTHKLFSLTHPDTDPGDPVAGDIILANGTPEWIRLPKGDDDKILTLKSGFPSWEPAAGAGAAGLFTLEVDENFNDLVDGDIDGKGAYVNWSPWVSNNAGSATTKVVDLGGGNKILRLEYDGGEAKCHLQFSGVGDGGLRSGFVVKMRARMVTNTTSHKGEITANTDATVRWMIAVFQENSMLRFYDSAGLVYIDPYVADTWYEITAIHNAAGYRLNFSGFLDGDYKCGDAGVVYSNYNLNRLNLRCYRMAGQFDIDWIKLWRLNTE